jgi:hypothetical protein
MYGSFEGSFCNRHKTAQSVVSTVPASTLEQAPSPCNAQNPVSVWIELVAGNRVEPIEDGHADCCAMTIKMIVTPTTGYVNFLSCHRLPHVIRNS